MNYHLISLGYILLLLLCPEPNYSQLGYTMTLGKALHLDLAT